MNLSSYALIKLRNTDTETPGAFGRGCIYLLEGIEEEHSLNKAAKRLGMAYSKAWRIMNEAEGHMECKLIIRDGAHGSSLTDDGRRILKAYKTLDAEVQELIDRRIPELFYSNEQ